MSVISVTGLPSTDIFELYAYGTNAEKRAAAKLSGLLQVISSGYLILAVPTALIRGVFDALDEPGISLPSSIDNGAVRAGIVVMTPSEIESLGGATKITERGRAFSYSLGDLVEAPAIRWPGVAKCWHLKVKSPELGQLRRSYGLPTLIAGESDFSIVVACQKTGVLAATSTSKSTTSAAAPYRLPAWAGPANLLQRIPSDNAKTAHDHIRLLQLKSAASAGWYLAPSDIAGTGIFANKPYDADELVGVAMTSDGNNEFGARRWNLTTLARYCNHQNKANVKVVLEGDTGYLVATKPVAQDSELFANYGRVTQVLGPQAEMLWEGKPVPSTDLSGYKEKDND